MSHRYHIPDAPASPVPLALSSRSPISSYDGSLYETSYSNYSEAFADYRPALEEYSYDSRLRSPSQLSPKRAPGQIEALGSRFLTAFSDNVRIPPAVTATASSLSRRTSLHARARSLANFVPSLAAEHTAGPALGRRTSMRIGNLLGGKAAQKPIQEVGDEEDVDDTESLAEYKPTFTATPERPSASRRNTPVRTQSQKSSWFPFRQEQSQSSTPASKSPVEAEDELLNLNITSQLFPHGGVDPMAPSSFNDLLINAESLIKQFQAGYKEKVELLRAARAEREAQSDEAEEAKTRAQHFKIQLDDMAARAAEQDKAMQSLADQLMAERLGRQEDRERAQRDTPRKRDSLKIVPDSEEDLTPRRKRSSEGIASDSGFESDADTASTFSGPTTPVSPRRDMMSLNLEDQTWDVTQFRPKNLDSVLSRQSLTSRTALHGRETGSWDEVSSLRQDNSRLQSRVRDLEGAVESCLSIVGFAGH